MEKINIGSLETKDFFVQAFRDENLIPILGAGFSCGMKARKGSTIPTGSELKEHMIEIIISERKEFTVESLDKQSFSWISERFFKCGIEKICEYFYNHFTGIRFSGINKEKFLNEIEWPYVYTLNVDTAIENSKDKWEVFYPNCNFIDKSVFDKKKLYKIHGDINLFCKTKNIDDLIFSESQYLKSIETNLNFHDKLAADCVGKNLLYVGCSLDDEIDIKYSVISDKNRNANAIEARRIYITADDIENDAIKIENLESFQITHYIKLNSIDDYEMFYEFMVECYIESLKEKDSPIECYEVREISTLDDDREKNMNFLINSVQETKLVKPFYYFNKSNFSMDELCKDAINVFIGRRFSGKTMFSYNIMDYFQDRKKYFISSFETISDANLLSLIREKNVLIIFDANSITEDQLNIICKNYNELKIKTSIICVFMNTFDEMTNLVSYYMDILEEKELNFKGYLTQDENEQISEKLNSIGLLAFDYKQTILDNTVRIANTLDRHYLDKYAIGNKNELLLLIWIAVNKKIYIEEIFGLGLHKDYLKIVDKFSPILEMGKNTRGDKYEHSSIKIICNAPLALLQILNYYVYPVKSEMGNIIKEKHFRMVCCAIYSILFNYEKKNADKVKKFLMFDVLNDIFSRQYSKENIDKLLDEKQRGSRTYGAAALIQAIYEDKDIQKLKSREPNYWLQRAKSLYILNCGKNGQIERLKEGVEWAKIAEGDSETLINNGQNKYYRTLSNAIVQIAMLYGKLANKENYKNKDINTSAIHYYYKGLCDANNMQAMRSLIDNSRGTKDFMILLERIKKYKGCIYDEAVEEAEFLCNIPEYSNGICYKLK